jgi:hypothetical protein
MVKVEIPPHLREQGGWGRLPKPGQRRDGLSRTTLLEIIQDPRSGVKSVVIRKPGAIRGIRLIYLPSLHEYLGRLADLQQRDGAKTKDSRVLKERRRENQTHLTSPQAPGSAGEPGTQRLGRGASR